MRKIYRLNGYRVYAKSSVAHAKTFLQRFFPSLIAVVILLVTAMHIPFFEWNAEAAAPATRSRTVEFFAGQYSSTTLASHNVKNDFAAQTLQLAETNVDVVDAYVEVSAQIGADASTTYASSYIYFDSCVPACAPATAAFTTTAGLGTSSGESQSIRFRAPVTSEAEISSYVGGNAALNFQVGYCFATGTSCSGTTSPQLQGVNAKLVVTYTYDPASTTQTNTVLYPVESAAGVGSKTATQAACTMDSDCPSFSYNADIPELTSQLSQHFNMQTSVDVSLTKDLVITPQINGNASGSPVYREEALSHNGGWVNARFSALTGYANNTAQSIELGSNAVGNFVMGGENNITYTYSNAAPTKTKSVSLPAGELVTAVGSTTKSPLRGSTVYLPETGVSIKKAWFRVHASKAGASAGTLALTTKVGSNAESAATSYSVASDTVDMSQDGYFIHMLPASDYAHLATATASSGIPTQIAAQWTAGAGGAVSAELVITYQYAGDDNGYLSTQTIFSGQQTTAPSYKFTTNTGAVNPFIPESTGMVSIRGASLLLNSKSGAAATADEPIGVNLVIGNCTAATSSTVDVVQELSSFMLWKDVSSVLTSNDLQTYTACSLNKEFGLFGSTLTMTYQWSPPPTINEASYRFYNNADDVQPGTALASENTAASFSADPKLRLRMGLDVSEASMIPNSQNLRLQYADSTAGPWTDVSGENKWYDDNWSSRRKITLNNSASTENLSNFPLRVSLNPDTIDYAKTQNSGQDLRFTDSDGTTLLSHEIEFWNKSSVSEIWVKIPQIDAGSTTDYIYMYYGNSLVADGQNPSAVWDTNYKGVWHMKEDPSKTCSGTLSLCDSTSNGHHAASLGGMTSSNRIPAKVGNGTQFDGTDDYFQVANLSSVIAGVSNLTLEGWAYTPFLDFDHRGFFGFRNDANADYYILQLGGDVALECRVRTTSGVSDASGNSPHYAWNHVALVYNGSSAVCYVNGVAGSPVARTGTITDTTRPFHIGDSGNGTFPHNGMIDEVRLSTVTRSSEWIEAIYNSSNNTMNSFGLEQTGKSAPVWKYADNPSVANGTTITTALLSGTPVVQSYSEYNPTVGNPNRINPGQRGEWDFVLDGTNAATSTAYYFRLIKYDGSTLNTYTVYPQVSKSGSNTAPNSAASMAQKKTDDTVIATGGWSNSRSVKFTASASDPELLDTLQLCVEADLIGTAFSGTEDLCGAGVAYIGAAISVDVTISAPTDPGEYHWQARVKDASGQYSSWVSYDLNAETARDFGVDTTAPTGGTVYDGGTTGVDGSFNDGSLSALSANWSGFNPALSGLAKYEYSIGTSAGGIDARGWTDVAAATSVNATGLTLQTSQKYFVNVRATDNAGNSATVSSDGQYIAPTVSFSVSPASITFANLGAGNAFTDTKDTTLTTSTNAYGGYVVRSFISDLLRSADNATIPLFGGGTYDSPDSWQPGDTGFGYTSSDTSVQGVNKFQAATCPGGSGLSAPGCYAPFTTTGPGDIVADHTANVTGTPITNQQFTITYRTTTANTQAPDTYNSSVIYTITPVY